MMELKGKHLVILVADNFEDLELYYPLLRLKEAGAEVTVVGNGDKEVYKGKTGYPVKAQAQAGDIQVQDIDGLLIPGGWAPDILRRQGDMLELVQKTHQQGKVIGAICHAAWVLISAGILRGYTMTAVSAIKDDVMNAGAEFVDEEVVIDRNLITSRTPKDLPAFMRTIIEKLS